LSRVENLKSWHDDWSDLRVAVIGLGVTGFSVADTLAELGAHVKVFAERAEAEQLDILDVLGVAHVTGSDAAGLPNSLLDFEPELIITSPGVRPDSEMIRWAESEGLPVWVDIDLAWRLRDKVGRPAEWLCVTGTNGKTTTVQLTTAILREAGLRVEACGNIGTPILDCIREPEGFDVLVVELSSFQLHYLGDISPTSSAVLNVDHDHLDWHGGFEAYRVAKGKVYSNTQIACVYNVADAVTERLVEEAEVVEGARAIGFTVGAPGLSQIGFVEDILCDRAFIEERRDTAEELATIADVAEIGVITPHLLANVAAAAALSRSLGIPAEAVRLGIRNFRLDRHRIEVVLEHGEITWIDDSKATNPHAAAASLASFDSIVWVVGGLLKGVDVRPLVERFSSKLRGVVVIGKERELVLEALREFAPKVPVIEVITEDNIEVMPQAVSGARALAQAGDTVLLAPAAASMDQFKDYADRGFRFAEAVKALGE
jgi:UDP-N-acetylmuramoylalanine--D-glutamate ligase